MQVPDNEIPDSATPEQLMELINRYRRVTTELKQSLHVQTIRAEQQRLVAQSLLDQITELRTQNELLRQSAT